MSTTVERVPERKLREAPSGSSPGVVANTLLVCGIAAGALNGRGVADLARTALHPRLRQPMSVTDLCFFVAEHDDHHLQTIEELKKVTCDE